MKGLASSVFLVVVAAATSLSGCRSLIKKEVPTQKVRIENLVVSGQYPENRDHFVAWAMITGYKSGPDSDLLPPRQWRDGFRVHLEQLERPASAEDMNRSLTPFNRSLPIDVSGLSPGFYIVNVNGSEKRLEIPEPPLTEVPLESESVPASQTGAEQPSTGTTPQRR